MQYRIKLNIKFYVLFWSQCFIGWGGSEELTLPSAQLRGWHTVSAQ